MNDQQKARLQKLSLIQTARLLRAATAEVKFSLGLCASEMIDTATDISGGKTASFNDIVKAAGEDDSVVLKGKRKSA